MSLKFQNFQISTKNLGKPRWKIYWKDGNHPIFEKKNSKKFKQMKEFQRKFKGFPETSFEEISSHCKKKNKIWKKILQI